MKLSANGKNLLIDAGTVAAGGVATMVAEYVTLKYVSQAAANVGSVNVNAGDAVGLAMSAVAMGAGAKMKRYRVFLFGTGSLAVSLATLVGKVMISSTATAIIPAVVPATKLSMPSSAIQMVVPATYSIAPAEKGNYR